MARFGGMAKLSKLVALLLATMLFLSGCSADILRPDLFHDSDMRAWPEWADDTEDSDGGESKVRPGPEVAVWPGGNSGSSGSHHDPNYSYDPPKTADDVNNFAGMPSDTMQCSDYWEYLSERPITYLQEILDKLPEETRKDIYLRVGHTGYDIEGDLEKDGRIRRRNGQSLTLYGSNITSARLVGGDVLLGFADNWVGGLADNADYVTLQVQKAQNEISNVAREGDWDQKWMGLSDAPIPQVYKNMMGRDDETRNWTLRQYYDAIASDPQHNIPNFSLQMRAGDSGTDSMVFNATGASILDPFQSGVTLDTVDKVFRVQNQYITRDRSPVDVFDAKDSSMIRYYIDGYNKTVIFLGCADGKSLKDLLGDKYSEVESIIRDAYSCTNVASIKAIVPRTEYDESADEYYEVSTNFSNCVIIPAGTKGVD